MSVFIEGSGDGRTDLFLEAEAEATTPSGIPGGREENLEGKSNVFFSRSHFAYFVLCGTGLKMILAQQSMVKVVYGGNSEICRICQSRKNKTFDKISRKHLFHPL